MPERMRIKICGVRTADVARTAVEAGADAIGLVFAERSPRCLTVEQARSILAALPAFVDPVALFANADAQTIRRTVDPLPLRLVQLHGDDDPDAVAELSDLRVIRALPFEADTFADTLRHWDEAYRRLDHLAGLLIDTPRPDHYGGTGESFDWQALRRTLNEVNPAAPLILAGGLTAENVAEAASVIEPWAVDVSSGVESQRGVKDPEKIHAFCRAAQGIDV